MQWSFSLNNFGVSPSACNPGDGVSEVVLLLSHQRGKKPNQTKQNKTKNTTKCRKFKCNKVSVSFSACRCSLVVVSSKVGRKKKSLETVLWMAIWGCDSPARCSQPAVAGGFIYADLRGELNTHLAPQALFTQSSPVQEPLLQAFPFSSTLEEVTLHLLSQACVFIIHVGSGSSPLSCGVFLPPPLLQAFPFLVAGCVSPLLPSPAGLLWGIFPSPSLVLRALCVFFVVIAYYSVFFSFFLGWGSVRPTVVCGSTKCCLVHLVVCVFLSRLGAAFWWWSGIPPGFSIQCEVGMLHAGWGCGGVKLLPLLSGFSCKVYLQRLPKILL
jgi:hypothetical protein